MGDLTPTMIRMLRLIADGEDPTEGLSLQEKLAAHNTIKALVSRGLLDLATRGLTAAGRKALAEAESE